MSRSKKMQPIRDWQKEQEQAVLKKVEENELRDIEALVTKCKIKPKTANQDKYLKYIDKYIITLCAGPAGTGKAQPLYSKILTVDGWTTMGEISVGTEVCCPDGTIAKVKAVFPQGEKEIFRIYFEDDVFTDCCEEHLWKVFNPDFNDYKIVDLKTINKWLNLKTKKNRIGIPLLDEVKIDNKQDLKIDPYLLGVLIGDGCLVGRTPSFTSVDEELINSVEKIVDKYDCKLTKLSKITYNIRRKNKVNNISVLLKELGLFNKKSEAKFIPTEYLNSSLENRLKLIQGLMDTDGTVGKKKCITYCTVSKQLAEDMSYLIRSIGGLCKVRVKNPFYYNENREKVFCKQAYILNIRHKDSTKLFSLKRKKDIIDNTEYQYKDCLRRRIKRVENIGKYEAKCIMLDNNEHLYITDNFIVTHNTFLAMAKAMEHLLSGKVKKIILTRPLLECDEELGFLPGGLDEKTLPYMLPLFDSVEKLVGKKVLEKLINKEEIIVSPLAYMRGRSFDDSFIILDEAQNATYKQLKMFLTRFGEHSKIVVCGDVSQSDVNVKINPFAEVSNRLKGNEFISRVLFKREDIVRHPLIQWIDEKLS